MRRILVGVALAGCSVSSLDYAALDDALQGARCERFVTCGVFPDAASCRAYFGEPKDANTAAAIAAGAIHYHGDQARACVDALATLTCDTTAHAVRVRPEACVRMFEGALPEGAACNLDAECEAHRCVLPDNAVCMEGACCPGTCGGFALAAVGEACQRTVDCNAGEYCDNNHVCQSIGEDGDSCTTDAQCDAGFACSLGACRAAGAIGEACPFERCADLGAYCAPDGTCKAVGAPGDACDDGSQCSLYGECTNHVCAVTPSLGQACTSRCTAEAWCDLAATKKCAAEIANGMPCDAGNQCASGVCAPGPAFDACAPAPVCD